MSADASDELTRILATHREHVAAAKVAAQQRAREEEEVRHACEAPLRRVAVPPLREWSVRLATEGYPATVEDFLGCHPPSLVFRLAPHGAPASSLTLVCETGPAVRFRMNVDGRNIVDNLQTPLDQLETSVVLEHLGRFVTTALAATIPTRSDCWP
jgi:hypothetical protein